MIRRVTGAASIFAALLGCSASYAQQGDGTEVQITTNVFKPNSELRQKAIHKIILLKNRNTNVRIFQFLTIH